MPIFGLSDKIGLLVLFQAVQACRVQSSWEKIKKTSPERLEESKIKMSIDNQLSMTQPELAQLNLTQLLQNQNKHVQKALD